MNWLFLSATSCCKPTKISSAFHFLPSRAQCSPAQHPDSCSPGAALHLLHPTSLHCPVSAVLGPTAISYFPVFPPLCPHSVTPPALILRSTTPDPSSLPMLCCCSAFSQSCPKERLTYAGCSPLKFIVLSIVVFGDQCCTREVCKLGAPKMWLVYGNPDQRC